MLPERRELPGGGVDFVQPFLRDAKQPTGRPECDVLEDGVTRREPVQLMDHLQVAAGRIDDRELTAVVGMQEWTDSQQVAGFERLQLQTRVPTRRSVLKVEHLSQFDWLLRLPLGSCLRTSPLAIPSLCTGPPNWAAKIRGLPISEVFGRTGGFAHPARGG